MTCPRCGKQNEEDARFCARCGIEMALIAAPQPPPEGEMFCYRHPKRSTLLSCGHCSRPICTDCVVIGPAGPRCPDCARSNVAIRPAAVAYEAKRGLMSLFSGVGRNYFLVFLLISVVGMLFRGCGALMPQPREVPTHQEPAKPDKVIP